MNKYPLVEIPAFAKKSFFEFSKADAKEYLKWFLSIKEKRINILTGKVKEIYTNWPADFGKESLENLYDWLKQNVAYRPLNSKENQDINDQIAKTPLLLNAIPTPTQTFTDETVSICFDFGIYFGETVILNSADVKWMQDLSSKNFIDYAQPLIGKKGVKIPVNPRRVAEGYARRILDGDFEESPPRKLLERLIERFGR